MVDWYLRRMETMRFQSRFAKSGCVSSPIIWVACIDLPQSKCWGFFVTFIRKILLNLKTPLYHGVTVFLTVKIPIRLCHGVPRAVMTTTMSGWISKDRWNYSTKGGGMERGVDKNKSGISLNKFLFMPVSEDIEIFRKECIFADINFNTFTGDFCNIQILQVPAPHTDGDRNWSILRLQIPWETSIHSDDCNVGIYQGQCKCLRTHWRQLNWPVTIMIIDS